MGSAAATPSVFNPFGMFGPALAFQQAIFEIGVGAVQKNAGRIMDMMPGAQDAKHSVWDLPSHRDGNVVYPVTPKELSNQGYGPLLFFAPEGKPHADNALIIPPISFSKPKVVNPAMRGFADAGFNVAVQDWPEPNEMPQNGAQFGLNKQVDLIIDACEAVHKETGQPVDTLVLISQSGLPGMIAATLMEKHKHPSRPKTVAMFASPYNVKAKPTTQNLWAMAMPEGAWRNLFPRMPRPLLRDMMHHNFHEPAIAEGKFEYSGSRTAWRGKVVPAAMTETAVAIVEGKKDDICLVGQTSDFFRTSALPKEMRLSLVRNTNHYDTFDFEGTDKATFGKELFAFLRSHLPEKAAPSLVPASSPMQPNLAAQMAQRAARAARLTADVAR